MRIHTQGIKELRDTVHVAVSGGPDSMAALDYLRRGRRNVKVIYIHHGTNFGNECFYFVKDYCREHNIPYNSYGIGSSKPKELSQEEYWSIKRHELLNSLPGQVVMAHHLDDVAETWIWSSLHGSPKLINRKRDKVVRPFLLTRKEALVYWCDRKKIPYLTDPSNTDTKFIRNHIRHNLMPHALKVNPGLHSMLAKKLRARYNLEEESLPISLEQNKEHT